MEDISAMPNVKTVWGKLYLANNTVEFRPAGKSPGEVYWRVGRSEVSSYDLVVHDRSRLSHVIILHTINRGDITIPGLTSDGCREILYYLQTGTPLTPLLVKNKNGIFGGLRFVYGNNRNERRVPGPSPVADAAGAPAPQITSSVQPFPIAADQDTSQPNGEFFEGDSGYRQDTSLEPVAAEFYTYDAPETPQEPVLEEQPVIVAQSEVQVQPVEPEQQEMSIQPEEQVQPVAEAQTEMQNEAGMQKVEDELNEEPMLEAEVHSAAPTQQVSASVEKMLSDDEFITQKPNLLDKFLTPYSR